MDTNGGNHGAYQPKSWFSTQYSPPPPPEGVRTTHLSAVCLIFRAMTNSRSFGYESNFNEIRMFFKIRIFVLDMAHCDNVTHYTPNPTK